MKKLILIRHARAVQNPLLPDRARELTPQGMADAVALGEWLKGMGVPARIFCSPAVRTRATLAAIADQYAAPLPEAEFSESLYLGGPETLKQHIASTANAGAGIWLIGHNPDVHALAGTLAVDGPAQEIAQLMQKFSPGTAAALEGEGRWPELMISGMFLRSLFVPGRMMV